MLAHLRKIIRILVRLGLSTFMVCSFMVITQDIQIFPGTLAGLIQAKEREQESLPTGVESEFIKTSDGERLELWHVQAANINKEGSPVAIIFHGNAESVDSSYDLQRWLRALGVSSTSFDYRGYNRSTGWPSDEGLRLDVQAVLGHVEKRYPLDKHPLLLLGVSIGTGLASYAAQKTNPHTLVLIAPYTSLRSLVSELPLFGLLHPFLWYSLENEDSLQRLRDTCLIFAHGEQDNTISIEHSERLFNAMEHIKRKSFLRIKDAGHNDLFARSYKTIGQKILGCLQ